MAKSLMMGASERASERARKLYDICVLCELTAIQSAPRDSQKLQLFRCSCVWGAHIRFFDKHIAKEQQQQP